MQRITMGYRIIKSVVDLTRYIYYNFVANFATRQSWTDFPFSEEYIVPL